MTSDRYYENLELWSHQHPREAIWLQYFEVRNLEISLFHHENPVKEADEWFKRQDLSSVEVLYIYGLGLGYYYFSLKEWLKAVDSRHVVFLEDELEVLARYFETEEAFELLSDPQVSLFFFKEVSDAEQIFSRLFWSFPMAKIGFGALEYYEKEKNKKYEELKHQISYDAALKNSLLEEYLQFGIAFFRNFYGNILHINEGYLGNSLFGALDSMPAIICGAGPSLEKNIALLKELSNKAVIFAGSSALNALGSAGIKPHLGAGIDPNQMQEERLKNVKSLDFPYLYRNRIYPKALSLVTGPKLYITGTGGYDIANWFEERFQIEGKEIEEGRNVVNFCLEAAYEMGCNPIIFVGLDLAYTGLKAYTEGVIDNPSLTKKQLAETNDLNNAGVLKKDIYGNDIYTVWKWVAEAKWIGNFAQLHPEITLINATEGGLGFPGVPNMTLAEVAEEHLNEKYDIPTKIQSIFAPHSLSRITKDEILSAINEIKESLENCIRLLEILFSENETIIKELKKGVPLEHSQTGKAAMAETDLADETAFIYVLLIFNDVSSKLMQRDLMKLHNPANKATKLEKEIEILTLNGQKYQFLLNAAKINIELINYALNMDKMDEMDIMDE